MSIEEQIEWLEKEAQRHSQCASDKAFTARRRGTFRHRAKQLRKSVSTMEKLLAVYEAACGLYWSGCIRGSQQHVDLDGALNACDQTMRDPEDFNLWCATHQIPKTSYGCTYPDCDCTAPEKP